MGWFVGKRNSQGSRMVGLDGVDERVTSQVR